jgi:DNA polymerase III alpha subunit
LPRAFLKSYAYFKRSKIQFFFMSQENSQEKFAIRFGLGAIKAVGFGMMQTAIQEREVNGKFADIYDFAERLDPRLDREFGQAAAADRVVVGVARADRLIAIAAHRRAAARLFSTSRVGSRQI